MSNVIQAEFFHVGGAASLGVHLAELGDRMADHLEMVLSSDDRGPGIKTVVRFNDTGGHITEKAMELEHLGKRQDELLLKHRNATGLRREWLNLRVSHLSMRLDAVGRSVNTLCQSVLNSIALSGGPIAIEIFDHSFRWIRKDEKHEVLERVRQAKGLWVFIFEPNDLLADRNTIVTWVM